MPLYDFVNTETGEHFELQLKIAEREEYLANNPHIQQEHLSAPSIGDPIRLGIRRPDAGFSEVIRKVHERSPGSQLDKTVRF